MCTSLSVLRALVPVVYVLVGLLTSQRLLTVFFVSLGLSPGLVWRNRSSLCENQSRSEWDLIPAAGSTSAGPTSRAEKIHLTFVSKSLAALSSNPQHFARFLPLRTT